MAEHDPETQKVVDEVKNDLAAIVAIREKEKLKQREIPDSCRLGTIGCILCDGTISYTVSSYNGHIHASCSTKGCISFMM